MANNGAVEAVTGVSKWAFSWEPRAKLLAAIFFIFGVISLTTPSIAAGAYLISIIAILLSGVSFTLLLKRYLIILPFLLLMTVPLLFGQGLSYTSDNLSFATLIFIKAFTSMTIITIVLDSQSLDQFMNGLAGLKIPSVMITVLILSYRYVFLFLDDIQKMQTAAKSRFFNGGVRIRSLKVYGQLTGMLLIRSLDRADRMYQAMASRGFNGRLRFKESQKITRLDLFKTALASIIIISLVVIEIGYVR
ncbi:cobalt/nickel transport system permease protein [Virgibacillus natechei]|uniref:Cobalt/nickel transport system permease protein n=1 Tax=Virgibacillus natechei TaxID=1216297 RepID=A0ABS4IEU9_9BACI|nr:cobalt ECF transporter T component CbiQ [Virgibacillus natechei]MBP1969464.1 cobalt/nickel transport system permease protein [Virgibacillus natechei]UZD11830.1 cobalt ECF transporter T component CbiQ [Virgibacillus natechei]